MQKYWIVVILLAVIILDLAALDDITTGTEPNFTGEYLTLILSVPVLLFLVAKLLGKRIRK